MKPWMTKFWVRPVAILVFLAMTLLALLSAAGIFAFLLQIILTTVSRLWYLENVMHHIRHLLKNQLVAPKCSEQEF